MIFDFVLLAHFSSSVTTGFPSAAMKALGLHICGLLATVTQAEVCRLQKDGAHLSVLHFKLQPPEHPKSSSTVSGFRQCFVNHLRKIV